MIWEIYPNHENINSVMGTILYFSNIFLQGESILIVFVDDVIKIRNDNKEATKLEGHVTKHFEVKKLGTLKYFLGIAIAQSSKGLLMTQQKYILDLLRKRNTYNAILMIPY